MTETNNPAPTQDKPIIVQPTAAPALLEQGVRAVAMGGAGIGLAQIIHSDVINGFVAPSVMPFVGLLAAGALSYGWGVYVTLRNHHHARVLEKFAPDSVAIVAKTRRLWWFR